MKTPSNELTALVLTFAPILYLYIITIALAVVMYTTAKFKALLDAIK